MALASRASPLARAQFKELKKLQKANPIRFPPSLIEETLKSAWHKWHVQRERNCCTLIVGSMSEFKEEQVRRRSLAMQQRARLASSIVELGGSAKNLLAKAENVTTRLFLRQWSSRISGRQSCAERSSKASAPASSSSTASSERSDGGDGGFGGGWGRRSVARQSMQDRSSIVGQAVQEEEEEDLEAAERT